MIVKYFASGITYQYELLRTGTPYKYPILFCFKWHFSPQKYFEILFLNIFACGTNNSGENWLEPSLYPWVACPMHSHFFPSHWREWAQIQTRLTAGWGELYILQRTENKMSYVDCSWEWKLGGKKTVSNQRIRKESSYRKIQDLLSRAGSIRESSSAVFVFLFVRICCQQRITSLYLRKYLV